MKSKEILGGVNRTIRRIGQYLDEQAKKADEAEERALTEGKLGTFFGPGGGMRMYYAGKRLEERKSAKK